MKEYSSSILCFKADIIESLSDEDIFAVNTPYGVFQMSKQSSIKLFPIL